MPTSDPARAVGDVTMNDPDNATIECQGRLASTQAPSTARGRRGGWYTPRWVDRLLFPGNWPSATQLIPERPRPLRVGDRIPDGRPGTAWFAVERADPPKLLVLHSTTHLPASWRARLGAAIDWSWSFTLAETGDGGTRLLPRVRGRTRPWWLTIVYVATLVPADYVMASSMLAGIRRRAAPAGQHLGPGRIADDRGGQPA